MLMPDSINPKDSIYFNGAIVLKTLQEKGNMSMIELYSEVKKSSGMSLSTLIFSLDWLYLINAAYVTVSGDVELCI